MSRIKLKHLSGSLIHGDSLLDRLLFGYFYYSYIFWGEGLGVARIWNLQLIVLCSSVCSNV
jgi:hypothetical protein